MMLLGVSVLVIVVLVVFVLLWNKSVQSVAETLPLVRACPVCGHKLEIGENILAERTGVKKNDRERIFIKGCPYCLKKN